MQTVSVLEAKTHLSRLLRQASGGEEVVITRSGTPVARLVPIAANKPVFGLDEGRFEVPEDFNRPLDEDLLRAFQGAESGRVSSVRGGVQTPSDAVRRLSGPMQFFVELLKQWHLGRGDAALLLGLDPQDEVHVNGVLCGIKDLSGRDALDRVAHLIRIRSTLYSLFQDDLDVENKWLRETHSLLDGRSPMDVMLEGSMENLLLVRDYVAGA